MEAGTGGADGDLRSDRVHGQETTHPFHGGHRRLNQEFIVIVPASPPSTGVDR